MELSSHISSALVRVLGGPDGARESFGAGFVVSKRHIVTCARVVTNALNIPLEGAACPDKPVWVDLPSSENRQAFEAKPLVWYPVRDQMSPGELQDIAVLELCPGHSFPDDVFPAGILLLENSELFKFPLTFSGLADTEKADDWLIGYLRGSVSPAWIELEPGPGQRLLKTPFAGTPVWNLEENAIVGMLSGTRESEGDITVDMIPASSFLAAWPQLDARCRPRSPYRGLRPFLADDAADFYGRDRDTGELVDLVGSSALVSLVGAAGVGKSSLVSAGLAAKLQETGTWLVGDFRPSIDPLEGLATALAPLVYPASDAEDEHEAANRVYKRLTSGVLNVVDLVSEILQKNPNKRLLIVIDQFEELYTHDQDAEKQINFIDGVLGVVRAHTRTPKCCVLLTVRTDFFPALLNYEPLAEAIEQHPKKNLAGLRQGGMRSAILNPVKRLGVTFEKGLAERILGDSNGDGDVLPLLEFALTLLWERQTQRRLTHQAYDAIGGVQNALDHYADSVLRDYQDRRDALRKGLVQLVRPGQGTEDIRQIATREQLGSENWSVVAGLAQSRLLVTGYSDALKSETVELAHDIIIRHWRSLRQWTYSGREFRTWQNRLRRAMNPWKERQNDEELLLKGAALSEAEEWLESQRGDLMPGESRYIEASIERWASVNAGRRRLRWATSLGLFAASLAALAIAGVLFQRSLHQSGSRDTAQATLDQQPEKQLVSARQSGNSDAGHGRDEGRGSLPERTSAELAEQGAVGDSAEQFSEPSSPPQRTFVENAHAVPDSDRPLAFSPDGNRLVAVASENRLALMNAADGVEIASLTEGDAYADFSADGTRIVTAATAGVRVWSTETGDLLLELSGFEGRVKLVKFLADSRRILGVAVSGHRALLYLWDSSTGKLVKIMDILDQNEDFLNAVASPDGERLAVRGEMKVTGFAKTHVYDVLSGEKRTVIDAAANPEMPGTEKTSLLESRPGG